MSAALAVRPIALTDLNGFRDVMDAVARERKFLAFEEAPPSERMSAFLENNLRCGNPHFVGLVDGAIVGWCDIVRDASRTTRSHCGTLGMGVLSRHRGVGLGRLLLQNAMEAALAVGIRRIELTVRASNTAAIGLYRSAGFVEEGCQVKAIMSDGEYADRYLMAFLAI